MRTRGLRHALVATAALIATIAVATGTASAATITLTSNGDTGPGTLRAALASANPGDTILIPGSFTITLASPLTIGQPANKGGITIAATGAGTPTITGNDTFELIDLNSFTRLSLKGLTLSHGNNGASGGAIAGSDHQVITVTATTFDHNAASSAGGAIFLGSPGRLTIQSSTFSNNTAPGSGGAIFAENPSTPTIDASTFADNHSPGSSGGAIHVNHPGTLTIHNSTFTGNTAQSAGGAIQMNGDVLTALTVTGSTFNENSTAGEGGAIKMNVDANTFITNSTFTGNEATSDGGAIHLDEPANAALLNDTIAGNSSPAGVGGGLRLNDSAFNNVTVKNTIISGNAAPTGTNCSYVAPQITSLGHNIEQGTSCGFTAAGDQNANPKLTPLAGFGGPTQTMALLPGSPAINAGDNNGCPATDQRGVARPQAGVCDIGAFEAVFAPKCTLHANGSKVKHAKLTLTARCDEAASLKLSGKLKTKHKTFKLGPVGKTSPANTNVTFTLKLSKKALKALKKHGKKSASFTLTATNPSGTTTASAATKKLHS